ncbi:hypothetical protein [Paenibacillus agilis]|uniref:Uncharacterized protein n=1 Tax=Paenibacillus agilis TaxID=3020863 RepID=A0A559ID63_9BACL|nr:hypothetical protein [Paenibacillus agilis]TVX85566.1 hypothetical protein FPZ44_24735 [Paenibacillus agilis]
MNKEEINKLLGGEILPLCTMAGLAHRWNMTIQTVYQRSKFDETFPKSLPSSFILDGIKEKSLYMYKDVLAYEQLHRIGPAADGPLEDIVDIVNNQKISNTEKIRRLSMHALTRNQIAALLNVKYQLVANTQVKSGIDGARERKKSNKN